MTPPVLALLVGLASSAGMGYAPVGGTVGAELRSPHVEVRGSFDGTDKAVTGKGWNARGEVAVGGRMMAGLRYSAWSGGPWRKSSVALLAAWRIAPGVRLIADTTLRPSWYGDSRTGLAVEIEHGRVRATVGVSRAGTGRVGVTGGVEVMVVHNGRTVR